jgi:hypothetical protein
MIGATSALIGLAAYFLALFVFGLLWRRREVSQKVRSERILAGQPFSSQPAQTEKFAHLG